MREVCEMTHQKIVSVNDGRGRRRFVAGRRVDQGYPGMSDHSSRYYSRNAGCRKSPHTPHQVEYIFLMGTVGIEG